MGPCPPAADLSKEEEGHKEEEGGRAGENVLLSHLPSSPSPSSSSPIRLHRMPHQVAGRRSLPSKRLINNKHSAKKFLCLCPAFLATSSKREEEKISLFSSPFLASLPRFQARQRRRRLDRRKKLPVGDKSCGGRFCHCCQLLHDRGPFFFLPLPSFPHTFALFSPDRPFRFSPSDALAAASSSSPIPPLLIHPTLQARGSGSRGGSRRVVARAISAKRERGKGGFPLLPLPPSLASFLLSLHFPLFFRLCAYRKGGWGAIIGGGGGGSSSFWKGGRGLACAKEAQRSREVGRTERRRRRERLEKEASYQARKEEEKDAERRGKQLHTTRKKEKKGQKKRAFQT